MGPEIVNKTEYCGPPADIWALGVLLFTILSGCFPYRGSTDKELYDKISRAAYKLPTEVESSLSPEALELLASLFHLDADKRPSAKNILNHPWLQGVSLPPPSPALNFNPVTYIADKQKAARQEEEDVRKKKPELVV